MALHSWNQEHDLVSDSAEAAPDARPRRSTDRQAVAWSSDGGGSIRVPSSLCGAVGIKPSVGRVPTASDTDGDSTDGPLARTVLDAAMALEATAGHPGRPDGRTRRRLPRPGPEGPRPRCAQALRRGTRRPAHRGRHRRKNVTGRQVCAAFRRGKTDIQNAFRAAMTGADVLVTPATPVLALPHGGSAFGTIGPRRPGCAGRGRCPPGASLTAHPHSLTGSLRTRQPQRAATSVRSAGGSRVAADGTGPFTRGRSPCTGSTRPLTSARRAISALRLNCPTAAATLPAPPTR
ncbi:amidase family protein [Streptomyces turgidiscabies]|uniref:amidase family protein n=1 Tax=Streptomyces turgidiscabies TaxID=85558 RepID=UPI00076EAB96|nr:acylamidase [Streptomyces turgidiscabies]